MQNINVNLLNDFMVTKCNEILNIDISDKSKWNVSIFSADIGMTAWGLIHIIDEVNQYYNIYYNPSDIIEKSSFSLTDFVESIYSQLLKEYTKI